MMFYISQYSGEEIDASVSENVVQNNKIANLESTKVNKTGDTMSGTLTLPRIQLIPESDDYIRFINKNADNTNRGNILQSPSHNYAFLEYATDTNYYTNYYLPNPDSGLTANNSYPILTKNNFLDIVYPVGSIYESNKSTNPSSSLGGTWTLVAKQVIDTGWQDYIWTNSTYIGTSQSSYTQNKWRVKDNILYVHAGMGATATINTATEEELARIPITGGWPIGAENRIWNGAVGGSGAVSGLYIVQESGYVAVKAKPHTTANNHSAPWYSTFFATPLTDNFTFTSGSYDYKYIWKRTA